MGGWGRKNKVIKTKKTLYSNHRLDKFSRGLRIRTIPQMSSFTLARGPPNRRRGTDTGLTDGVPAGTKGLEGARRQVLGHGPHERVPKRHRALDALGLRRIQVAHRVVHQHRALRVPRQDDLGIGTLGQRVRHIGQHGLGARARRPHGLLGDAGRVGRVVDALDGHLVGQFGLGIRREGGPDHRPHVADLGRAPCEDDRHRLARIRQTILFGVLAPVQAA